MAPEAGQDLTREIRNGRDVHRDGHAATLERDVADFDPGAIALGMRVDGAILGGLDPER